MAAMKAAKKQTKKRVPLWVTRERKGLMDALSGRGCEPTKSSVGNKLKNKKKGKKK